MRKMGVRCSKSAKTARTYAEIGIREGGYVVPRSANIGTSDLPSRARPIRITPAEIEAFWKQERHIEKATSSVASPKMRPSADLRYCNKSRRGGKRGSGRGKKKNKGPAKKGGRKGGSKNKY